jgi:hypothetical protein
MRGRPVLRSGTHAAFDGNGRGHAILVECVRVERQIIRASSLLHQSKGRLSFILTNEQNPPPVSNQLTAGALLLPRRGGKARFHRALDAGHDSRRRINQEPDRQLDAKAPRDIGKNCSIVIEDIAGPCRRVYHD